MELKDLIITPIYMMLIYLGAYLLRPLVADTKTYPYFIPALTIKLAGAIVLGVIYQFYYNGGDTFTYFTFGSERIWEAFLASPIKAFKLIFYDNTYTNDTFEYSSRIWVFRDPSSYFVVRISGLFGLITFHTYSAVACLFALMSFSGLWAMYTSFYRLFPSLSKEFAIAIFFIPSVFFWGSGILKDTLTLGALGWLTYGVIELFITKDRVILPIIIMLFAAYIIYSIKIYILICYMPAVILFVFVLLVKKSRNPVLRLLMAPFLITIAVFLSYYAVENIAEENVRYNLDTITRTAEATARWLSFVSEQEKGSGYSLGDYDYSFLGMAKKFFPAIWVSLFRPYLWEVNSLIMFFAALESLGIFIFTIVVLFKNGVINSLKCIISSPVILFCITFSISFAFAVGFSTYNFGSLVRYKIPLIPFYVIGLFLIYHSTGSDQEYIPDEEEGVDDHQVSLMVN